MHLKGSKKLLKKRSFIAEMYLQITTNPMLTKPKTPLKIHFWIQTKTLSSILIFSEGVMSLHLSKFGF